MGMGMRELETAKATLLARADEIAAAADTDDGWTDEQREEYDAALAKVEQINADIKRAGRRLELDKAGASPRPVPLADPPAVKGQGIGERFTVESVDDDDDAPVAEPKMPVVYRGMTGQTESEAMATALGAQLIDIVRASTGAKIVSQRLGTIQAAATGAGEAVGADGGFFLQTNLVAGLLQRIYDTGQLVSRVRNIPLGPRTNGVTINGVDETSRATGSRFGGVQGYWVDEGTAPTASRPTFHKHELRLKKLACLGYATEELMEDGVAMGSVMMPAFQDELTFLVENAIIRGTGVGQPLGILTSAATVSIAAESGQAAATVVQANLSNMYARIWARSRQNAVWLVNQDVEPQFHGMSIANQPVYMPPGGLSAAPYGTLFGRPVLPVEYCSTLGTVGDIIFADLSQYLFIARQMRTATSMHVRFIEGEEAFRVTWRVDGQPGWHSALTPFQGSNTQSPFITLATRS